MSSEYKRTASDIRKLPGDVLQKIVKDWMDAYEDDWRPSIYVQGQAEDIYEQLQAISRSPNNWDPGYSANH